MAERRHSDDVRWQAAVRRAGLYSALFVGAAVIVAILGAALVAWLLTFTGMPFLRTWLIVTMVIVLPGLAGAVWRLMRDR
ncbi:MAG TPA: hypothetical protein VK929_10245 [Longimicrobiales bacterium]|nr:hypothetical protein [Longimicrobiales bacterium]